MSKITKTLVLILSTVVIITFTASTVWPSDYKTYESKTAQQKLDYLMEKVRADNNKPFTYYGALDQAKLILSNWLGGQDLHPVWNHHSDQEPADRKKLIHTVGWTCSIKFDMVKGNKYTGGFQGGIGVARFSSATAPAPKSNAPGISWKILRDGVESASFMSMWDLAGQTDTDNFFDKPMSNHVDMPEDKFSLDVSYLTRKALLKKFLKEDSTPIFVGTSDLASYTSDGQKVANPKGPFQLLFKPNPEIKDKLKDVSGYEQDMYKGFEHIKADDKLYKIYAVENPVVGLDAKPDKMEHIGYVVATSPMYRSQFMDKDVFFRHVLWTEEQAKLGDVAKNWHVAAQDRVFQAHAGVVSWKGVLDNETF